MKRQCKLLLNSVLTCYFLAAVLVVRAEETKRPNVLFIAIDDLRPALGCYDDTVAVTPNIDRLASRGTVFHRACCQQAVCSPSRLSLMTGRRPDTICVWDLSTHFRTAIPDVVTLPQHFKNNDYHTQSLGKIYHGSGKPSKDPPSWSVEPQYDFVRDPKLRYSSPKNLQGKGLKRSAAEAADVPDSTYIDGIVCNAAIQTLGKLQQTEQPFFLAVGFRKPHLPFCAPQKYWDLYDRAKIPLPVEGKHPQDAPELATRSWKELEGYTDIPNDGQLSTDKIRELRHGYYACVSYVDALVGRLLDELRKLKLAKNTVVVLWGDDVTIAKSGIHGGGTTVDETNGDILVFVEDIHPPAPLTVYRSKDEGRTWRADQVTIRPDSKGRTPSMHMNEHGVTLRHGEHKGRLIRPSRYYGKVNRPESLWPTHFTNGIYSDDGGKTWPLKRLVHEGAFAYSSLAAGRPGTRSEGWIYLHFESGGSKVARFNLGWLRSGEATGDGTVPEELTL